MGINKCASEARQMIMKAKEPIMFIDTDTDGSMSYVQLKNTFANINYAYPMRNDEESQGEAAELIEDKHDLVIIFDKGWVSDKILEASKGKQVLWVDHHVPTNVEILAKNKNVYYMNPMMYTSTDSRCSAYLAYLIAERDAENLFYVALGSVADAYILDVLIDLYEYNPEHFDLLFNISEEKRFELFAFINSYSYADASVQDKRIEWVRYLSYECGFILYKNFFDILYKIQKPNEAVATLREIWKMDPYEFRSQLVDGKVEPYLKYKEIMEEYHDVYKKIRIKEDAKLIFIEHETETSFNRQLAEELAARHPNSKVICTVHIKEDKDFVSGSLRGNGFDVNELILHVKKGIDMKGGGHKMAAGFMVAKEDYEIFKQRIKEYVKEEN